MAQELKLFRKCPQCDGTGIHNGISCAWPQCNGTGFIFKTKFTLDPGVDDVITEALAILNSRINLLRVYVRNNYNKIDGLQYNSDFLKDLCNEIKNKCNDIEDKCSNMEDKCNDIEDKCDDVSDKCDDIIEILKNNGFNTYLPTSAGESSSTI